MYQRWYICLGMAKCHNTECKRVKIENQEELIQGRRENKIKCAVNNLVAIKLQWGLGHRKVEVLMVG